MVCSNIIDVMINRNKKYINTVKTIYKIDKTKNNSYICAALCFL